MTREPELAKPDQAVDRVEGPRSPLSSHATPSRHRVASDPETRRALTWIKRVWPWQLGWEATADATDAADSSLVPQSLQETRRTQEVSMEQKPPYRTRRTVVFRIPETLHGRLLQESIRAGVSMTSIFINVLERYLDEREHKTERAS